MERTGLGHLLCRMPTVCTHLPGGADGCDLVSGLEESLRCVWNGDVDLDTGELRLKRIASILESITQDTLKVLKEEDYLTDDILFVSKGISLVIIYLFYIGSYSTSECQRCVFKETAERESTRKNFFFSLHGIWTICLVSRRMVVN